MSDCIDEIEIEVDAREIDEIEIESGIPGPAGDAGEDGDPGAAGKAAYASYLETTADDPVLSEEEWAAARVGAFAELSDRETADLPAINGPLGVALAALTAAVGEKAAQAALDALIDSLGDLATQDSTGYAVPTTNASSTITLDASNTFQSDVIIKASNSSAIALNVDASDTDLIPGHSWVVRCVNTGQGTVGGTGVTVTDDLVCTAESTADEHTVLVITLESINAGSTIATVSTTGGVVAP